MNMEEKLCTCVEECGSRQSIALLHHVVEEEGLNETLSTNDQTLRPHFIGDSCHVASPPVESDGRKLGRGLTKRFQVIGRDV
jgi:hypothetical protein